jgi:two-component system OmpR family sensor kinase
MKLRVRLLSATMVFIVVASLLGLFLVHSVRASEIRQVDQQLETFLPASRIAGNAKLPAHPSSGSTAPVFNANHYSALYLAIIANGTRRVLSTPLGTKNASPDLPTKNTTSLRRATIVTVGSTTGSLSWRAIRVTLPHVHAEVLVAVPLSQVNATMRFLQLSLLLTGAIILAVLTAAGIWITRLGLRPIAEVTEVAEAIVEGDRTRRVAVGQQGTEAGRLARAFNVMLDEQQDLESRLRQFVADASHELRTPVSVILGITELWRRGELRNGIQRDEAIHRIGVSGTQMGRLVEDLLLLARLDEGRPLEDQPVDLRRVIYDVVADVVTTDPTRNIVLDAPHPVVVQGDEASLRQVAVNLVSNAVRHTSDKADVRVSVFKQGDTAVLEVKDSGPGMTHEDAARAFDRFWQADSSRSRAGAGLGLAIVRGILDAHHGEVTFSSDILTGTRVRVSIPRGATNRQLQSTSPIDQQHVVSTLTSKIAEVASFRDVDQSAPRSYQE